jgi:hypothetical protein
MSVEWEMDDLEKVFKRYGFETEKWLIPTKSSHLKLMSKILHVVESHDRDLSGQDTANRGEAAKATGDLVIVYYAGHGFVNEERKATWCW